MESGEPGVGADGDLARLRLSALVAGVINRGGALRADRKIELIRIVNDNLLYQVSEDVSRVEIFEPVTK
jgi:hypothetical protein